MKGDLNPAAFRLSSALGVRTVEQKTRPTPGYVPRKVRFKGNVYASVEEAAQATGYAVSTIRSLISRGHAEYL